ncbi:hypothetical protein WJX72_009462 [[Myrmecia] bisecta]|uniref:Uncharacterized protein n=1 Tax=[Myrmecia] bisecta TaxID=41462 RepID=A0AAW1PUB1_9CHLO
MLHTGAAIQTASLAFVEKSGGELTCAQLRLLPAARLHQAALLLSKATAADLRADGFGYSAKFIKRGCAAGEAWTRQRMAAEPAHHTKCVPINHLHHQVATCCDRLRSLHVRLFLLGKTGAPHVWWVAIRYCMPSLKGKTHDASASVAEATPAGNAASYSTVNRSRAP